MKFDETDVRIIRNLQRDARTSFADIAAECSVSVDTIIKRFQRLRRNGIVVRRQHPIGRFVVDFAIVTAKLVIEVDGGRPSAS